MMPCYFLQYLDSASCWIRKYWLYFVLEIINMLHMGSESLSLHVGLIIMLTGSSISAPEVTLQEIYVLQAYIVLQAVK